MKTVSLIHKRKAGAFKPGELLAGEFGLDVTSKVVYVSFTGDDLYSLPSIKVTEEDEPQPEGQDTL